MYKNITIGILLVIAIFYASRASMYKSDAVQALAFCSVEADIYVDSAKHWKSLNDPYTLMQKIEDWEKVDCLKYWKHGK